MKKFVEPELEFLTLPMRDVICSSKVDIGVSTSPGDGVIDNWIT